MARRIDQYIWNFLFSLVFIGLIVYGVELLAERAYVGPGALSVFDIVLLSLATFRLTRLFVYDKIMAFVRDLFYNVSTLNGEVVRMKPERGPRRTIADLLSCPWCFGVWAALAVTFAYLYTPYAYVPVLILAIAGVATFVQLLANLIGWHAEAKKQEVE